MANAMVSLATITLGTTTSSVTFSNIPTTYKDLRLVAEASTTADGVTFDIRFNGDTGSNYFWVEMTGRNNGVSSSADNQTTLRPFGNTFGTVPFQVSMDLFDYSSTDKQKTSLICASSYDTSLSSYLVKRFGGRWANTSSVTSINLTSQYNSRSFAAGSIFSLYGIVS